MQQEHPKKLKETEFFTEYGEANRYKIVEVIGKGSYGVVCAAIDTHTGEKVAIKKIHDVFEHISDAIRILREVKLLRLLRHPDIVAIKTIMLPPSKREFRDIYVVSELMESDLQQVIKANDDLTREHHRFFLYQMLRALKYMHAANVYHRDLKPKNILATANFKLKVCNFGLARVAFSDTPTTIFWTDYVATRWYRAPELCGSFFSKYTPAIDTWSIGCIFAEVLTGKPLFPGKSAVHQLDLITDLLGTPTSNTISGVRNDKARKYLTEMRSKQPVPFSQKFPNADPLALKLLQRLLAFDPKDRPTAEEALADPYFKGLAKVEREPSCNPISKLEFEFERRRGTKDDIRELIYREILEYHPQLLNDYMNGCDGTNFLYPSVIGQFRRQFAHLEEHGGRSVVRKHVSLPRGFSLSPQASIESKICYYKEAANRLKIEPSSFLAIEDSLPGVTAGMEVVDVPSLPKQSHLYTSANEVINSLLDLRPEKWGLPPFQDWIEGTLPLESWHIGGPVIKGFGRGSKVLGIPTANLSTEGYTTLLLEHPSGVYFGWAGLSGRGVYKMVMSIGWNPYFNNKSKTIEPWLLHEFDEDFYGEELNLVIVGYIRPEMNFSSLEALIEKIHDDRRVAEKALELPLYLKHKDHPFLKITNVQ